MNILLNLIDCSLGICSLFVRLKCMDRQWLCRYRVEQRFRVFETVACREKSQMWHKRETMIKEQKKNYRYTHQSHANSYGEAENQEKKKTGSNIQRTDLTHAIDCFALLSISHLFLAQQHDRIECDLCSIHFAFCQCEWEAIAQIFGANFSVQLTHANQVKQPFFYVFFFGWHESYVREIQKLRHVCICDNNGIIWYKTRG